MGGSMRYSKWDEVILKVDEDFGYRDKVVARLKVRVIGYDDESNKDYIMYLCYIPPYENIPHGFETFTIKQSHIKTLKIEPKFLGDTACWITSRTPIFQHLPAPEGETCDKCNNWFSGAVRSDNVYMCRACRENPYR